MNSSAEAQVLHWFDRALEQPSAQRRDWVVTQGLPEVVQSRVLRLVDAELMIVGFLEETTRLPHASDLPPSASAWAQGEFPLRSEIGECNFVHIREE